jgi:glutamate synthase domain-containing protein 1
MRKAQKNGIRKVKNNSDIQKIRRSMIHERRRQLKELWQDPTNFRTNSRSQVIFKGYKTPTQIKARVKKMKNKKVKGSASLSSLWS